MKTYEEFKITRVTPGKLSRYIDHAASETSANVGRASSATFVPLFVPAAFKMYVSQVKISKVTMVYIRKNLTDDIFITLRWNLFDIQGFITSPDKLDSNKAKFDFTAKYRLQVNREFIENVGETPILFKLYACTKDSELFLTEAQLFVDDILEIVNEKQQQKIFFTNNVIDPSGNTIAYLDVWYKFTCKQATLKAFFPAAKLEERRKRTVTKMSGLLNERFSSKTKNFGNVYVTDSELDHFADSVWLVLNRNKVLKTTQSDINTELQERVRWMHFEANWKQTLQENAILHGKNPEDVIWRQWREEDTANVRLRTYDDASPQNYPPFLSITVVDLFFLEGCSLLKNDDIQQFYVEYSFLGYEGPKMETPFSKPKVGAEEKITFNFKKTFPIDSSKDFTNCHKLTELIRNDGIVKFVVISEPIENLEKPIQTCQEIGFSEVLFNELIQLQANEDIYEYEVIDINNPIAVLGYLTIKFEGILAMRKMALDIMAPKGYKLYV